MSPATPVAPCDFVVFGGTGDLAVRKLLPALYLRDRDGQLPAETRIIAASRAGLDGAGYRVKVRGALSRFVAKAAAKFNRPTMAPLESHVSARSGYPSGVMRPKSGWPIRPTKSNTGRSPSVSATTAPR